MLFTLQFLLAFLLVWLSIRYLLKKSEPGLKHWQLTLVLVLKIAAGCLYGWIFLTKYGGDDTWITHADSLAEWKNLQTHPGSFFVYEMDLAQYIRNDGWIEGLGYFRMKLEKALINKPLGLFNFYSQGNYYINVIAFSFMSFWGAYWLYQVLSKLYPAVKGYTFWIIFLYPPALFWLSGIRSDALLFFFFSLFVTRLYKYYAGLFRPFDWLVAGLAVLGLLVLKASFTLLLLVAALAFLLVQWKKWSIPRTFVLVYGAVLVVYFLTALLPPPLNLPEAVRRVQQQFFVLHGNTRIPLPVLEPVFSSYLQNLPEALDNIFLRPYPWEARGLLQYGMVIQNIFLLCMMVLVLIRRAPGRNLLPEKSFLWLFLFFSLSFYLSIGYTVPFPGAVIRYRVIPETLLIWMLTVLAGSSTLTHYKYFNVYKN